MTGNKSEINPKAPCNWIKNTFRFIRSPIVFYQNLIFEDARMKIGQ
jgi:hypothetical protein